MHDHVCPERHKVPPTCKSLLPSTHIVTNTGQDSTALNVACPAPAGRLGRHAPVQMCKSELHHGVQLIGSLIHCRLRGGCICKQCKCKQMYWRWRQ
eukprot:1138304-Pelagomonas_calceolata.AAC.1